MRSILVYGALALLAGCASAQPRSKVVRSLPQGECENLGEVTGKGLSPVAARKQMAWAADAKGANLVVPIRTLLDPGGRRTAVGRAMRCGPETVAEAPTAGTEVARAQVPPVPTSEAIAAEVAELDPDEPSPPSPFDPFAASPPPIEPSPFDPSAHTHARVVAPPEEAPEATPAKTDSLEGRLEKLKQLFERGLITQADYDKRRAELLQEL